MARGGQRLAAPGMHLLRHFPTPTQNGNAWVMLRKQRMPHVHSCAVFQLTPVITLTRVSPMPSPPTFVMSAVHSPSRDAPVSAFAQLPPPSICVSSHVRCKHQISTAPVPWQWLPNLPLQLSQAVKHDCICSPPAPLCASSHLALGSATPLPSNPTPGCRGQGP